MKPATTDELAERLQILFACLASDSAGEASDLRMQGYMIALRTFSNEIVSEAVVSILDGSSWNSAFVPKPPELAAVCREKAGQHQRAMTRLRITQQTLDGRADELTLEQRARMAAKAEMLSAQLDRTAAGDPLKKEVASGIQAVLAAIAAKARDRRKQAQGAAA